MDPGKPGPGIFCKRTFTIIAIVTLAAFVYAMFTVFLAVAAREIPNLIILKLTLLTYDRGI